MKGIWQIITLLLAVALVILSIKIFRMNTGATSSTEQTTCEQTQESRPAHACKNRGGKHNSEGAVSSEEAVIDAIMTRSSVRKYTDQKIDETKIETLLKAGMAAPTAGNRQPWDLIVINDRETLDAIPPIIKGAHMAAGAQLAIAVCGTPAQSLVPEYWVQDCSAVTENILLAAHAMGLGAVWCGAYPNNPENKVAALQKLFSLPQETMVLSIIVIGYPDGDIHVKNKWKPEKIHYNKF